MSDEVEAAAAARDADAIYAYAMRLSARAAELEEEARRWLRDASRAGSLDACHGLVRVAVAEREYSTATAQMHSIEVRFPDVPRRDWISVAPDALGRDLALDSDGASSLPGAGVFTIITPYGDRALEALRPAAQRLLDVDEFGGIQPPDVDPPEGVDPPFTPSWVDRLRWDHDAVQILLDTKGEMTGPMGRTMIAILVDALAVANLPTHVAGDCPDLRPRLHVDTYETV